MTYHGFVDFVSSFFPYTSVTSIRLAGCNIVFFGGRVLAPARIKPFEKETSMRCVSFREGSPCNIYGFCKPPFISM